MARPEIRALLAAPVGRAVLAELLDVDRLRLLPDIHEWPPEDVLDRACVAAAARLEELARTDDPVALLTGVARAIANWWFNPVEQMSVPHLAAAADALGTVAEAVVRSPAASWWWEPVDQHTQGWVGWAGATSPARGDELTGAIIQATAEEDESEARAAADPTWPPPPGVRTSGTWWSLPLGAGIVSTTRECFGVLPAVGIGCRQEWLGD